MATEIRVWQIENGTLTPTDVTMAEAGRTETQDLESWIKSNPEILGQDTLIIGEQVPTKSGSLDLLAIDRSGDVIVIELKRDMIPRQALAQAIDYTSDIASWDLDRLSAECVKYTDHRLEDYIPDNFEGIDLEELSINQAQRILLVGTSIEESLERMIEWLSGNYGMSINAVVFKYIKTRSGDELVARTMIIPEDVERERGRRRRRKPAMSDEPGDYDDDRLEELLTDYLSEDRATPRRIRDIALPLCLKHGVVTREMIKRQLVERGEADEGRAGYTVTTISGELSRAPRDYLRQIIRYDKIAGYEKENYRIPDEHKDLVRRVLEKVKG